MRTMSINLPELFVQLLDRLVDAGVYSSRCEAIRVAVRELLFKHGLLKFDENDLIIEPSIEGDKSDYFCPICGFRTTTLIGMKKHIRSHFSRLVKCPACGFTPRPSSGHQPVLEHLAAMARSGDKLHAAWYYALASVAKASPLLRRFARESFRELLLTGRMKAEPELMLP